MNLGLILAYLRKEKGQSQREFADSIGVSNGAVAMWETNKRMPDLDMIVKIANYYNVSLDYLLTNNITSFKELGLNKTSKDSHTITSDEGELLNYYNELSQKDKRWIMGQIIDLIKKEEYALNANKFPKAVQ